jgi:predicted ATPase/Tfp pilus assembly protein PilF
MQPEAFRAKLKSYLRLVGQSQKALAAELGLHADVLSHKLNGISNSHLTHAEVRLIALILARWLALTTQAEVIELLSYMDMGRQHFSEVEWQQPPLGGLLPAPAPSGASAGSATPSPSAIPAPVTTLIGREIALEQIKELQRDVGARLITLTGTGGVGKTRLALQLALDLQAEYAGGVYFISLVTITAPHYVLPVIGRGLKIAGDTLETLQEHIVGTLRRGRVLLVLDNFEHVLEAAGVISQLLAEAPNLTIITTSRTPLQLYGEYEFVVPPLDIPDLAESPTLGELQKNTAIRLFLARVRAVQPAFALTSDNAAQVAKICAHLDGLPLALELAAARMRRLSLDAVLSHMDDRLGLLVGGSSNMPERHQTLRNALAWSEGLLKEEDRRVFHILGVFVGSWTVEAAAEVCLMDENAADLLDRLADRSLIAIHGDTGAGDLRFHMLETIREFSQMQLIETRADEAARERHARYFLEMVERIEPELVGAEQRQWLDRIELDYSNIRAALQWADDKTRHDILGRAGAALWRFWWLHGYVSEGRQWIARALMNEEQVPQTYRGKLYQGAGALAWVQGDYDDAEAAFTRSLGIFRANEDRAGIAGALSNLGVIALYHGDYIQAADLYRQGLDLRRTIGDRWGLGISLNNLGEVLHIQGDYTSAIQHHQESLSIRRELHDSFGIASSLTNLGCAALAINDYTHAQSYFEEALTLFRGLGDKQRIALVLTNLGSVAIRVGELSASRAALIEALGLRLALGEKVGIAVTLQGWMELSTENHDVRQAATIGGAVVGLRRLIDAPLPPSEESDFTAFVDRIRSHMDQDAFDIAWRRGEAYAHEPEALCSLLLQSS